MAYYQTTAAPTYGHHQRTASYPHPTPSYLYSTPSYPQSYPYAGPAAGMYPTPSYGVYPHPEPHHAHSRSAMLPYGGYAAPGYAAPPNHAHPSQPPPPQETAPVTGGVSAVLDYDLDQMARFVSWIAYGLMRQRGSPSTNFEYLVRTVLSATRLPKATAILSLMYLNQRYPALDSDDEVSVVGTTEEAFLQLCTAFVLANKFNDDNTFTNSSWAEATGLAIGLINVNEREWLRAVSWNLNNTFGYDTLDQCWLTWCAKYGAPEVARGASPYSVPALTPSPEPAYRYYSSPAVSYASGHAYPPSQPQGYYPPADYSGWYSNRSTPERNIWAAHPRATPVHSQATPSYPRDYANPTSSYGCNYSSYNYGYSDGSSFTAGAAC